MTTGRPHREQAKHLKHLVTAGFRAQSGVNLGVRRRPPVGLVRGTQHGGLTTVRLTKESYLMAVPKRIQTLAREAGDGPR